MCISSAQQEKSAFESSNLVKLLNFRVFINAVKLVRVLDAKIREGVLHDVAHFGLRLALGAVFIVHGYEKLDPMFAGYLPSFGIPVEMQVPLALAELIPGILLIIGVLSRISSSLLAVVMTGAIFYVLHAASFTGQGGYEYPLVLLAANLVVVVIGPGRVSLSQMAKRMPRFLQ